MENMTFKHIAVNFADDVARVDFSYRQPGDPKSVAEIQEELNRVAGTTQGALLLNMATFEYFSSSFLGALVSLTKRMRREGRSFAICRLRPEPMRILRMTKLDGVVPNYPSEEEALTALMAAGGRS